ncbi:MAG TPA: complex I NDUFA9 subunit family protein [Caulobacteraceae bacterium]|jgi:NADH dehydrogenase|nr:complex I NDUFA9 subunit family protein [Caulobacteraceae bacterium]
MKGLVTIFGGSGFIGSQIVRALAKRDYRIRVAVRRPGLGYKLRMLGDVGQVEIVQANIRMPASIARALDGAEAAVNCVAVIHETGRQKFQSLHVMGARNIAEAASAAGVHRFVHISALGASPEAHSKYGRSKAAGEAAVRQAFPAATIVRPSVVFGQNDHFFNRFASLATFPSPIPPPLPLIGGGETLFQPVFVGDVAGAVAAALADPAALGATYELGGPGVHSFRELMVMMLAEIQRERLLLSIPFPLAGPIGWGGDAWLAVRGVLGFLPEPPITSDQIQMLRDDNVVAPGALGLADLGVTPTPMEPILPTYLYPYRKGGQYAGLLAPAPR